MALREVLGADVHVIHEQVDDLLNSEDALVILFDGNRMVSHAHGFAASPCHLELLMLEIERVARRIIGTQPTHPRRGRRNREERIEGRGKGAGTGVRQHLRRRHGGDYRGVVDGRSEDACPSAPARGHRCRSSGPVLRLASQSAASHSG